MRPGDYFEGGIMHFVVWNRNTLIGNHFRYFSDRLRSSIVWYIASNVFKTIENVFFAEIS